MNPLISTKPFKSRENKIQTGNPVNDQEQVLNKLEKVKQLRTAAENLSSITEQEVSVDFQESVDPEDRVQADYQVQQIEGDQRENVQYKTPWSHVVAGKCLTPTLHDTIPKKSRSELNEDVQQKNRIEGVVDSKASLDIIGVNGRISDE